MTSVRINVMNQNKKIKDETIKLLKHSSNGYTNWNRFRARVLYSLNDDIPIKL